MLKFFLVAHIFYNTSVCTPLLCRKFLRHMRRGDNSVVYVGLSICMYCMFACLSDDYFRQHIRYIIREQVWVVTLYYAWKCCW